MLVILVRKRVKKGGLSILWLANCSESMPVLEFIFYFNFLEFNCVIAEMSMQHFIHRKASWYILIIHKALYLWFVDVIFAYGDLVVWFNQIQFGKCIFPCKLIIKSWIWGRGYLSGVVTVVNRLRSPQRLHFMMFCFGTY